MASGIGKSRVINFAVLAAIFLNLCLCLWGITWGLPEKWHPDELTPRAISMALARSLNPHFFPYGAWHYYEIMSFSILPVFIFDKLFGPFPQEQLKPVVYLLARVLSALMTAGIVLLTYLIAKSLFEKRTALLATFLVAVSCGLISIGHFATTDPPSVFWFTMASLMAVYAWRERDRRWFLLAGLCAGLAAGVKYVGGIALIPMIVGFFLSEGRPRIYSDLLSGVLMSIVGFVVGNLTLVFAFREFLEGFVKEFVFTSARGAGQPYVFDLFLSNLRSALGTPMFILMLMGIVYSAWLVTRKASRAQGLMLLSVILPYYILMGLQHVSPLRYSITIIPPLLIAAGKLLGDSTSPGSRLKAVALAVWVVVIGYSLFYSVLGDLQFVHDSRYLASAWISKNAPPGSSIETTSYGPNLSATAYRIVRRPHDPFIRTAQKAAEGSSPVRPILDATNQRVYYEWFQQGVEDYQSNLKMFDITAEGLKARKPDYVVVSSLYYDRFAPFEESENENPVEQAFFRALLREELPYRKVATFKYKLSDRFDPPVEFVNPEIHIFQRVD